MKAFEVIKMQPDQVITASPDVIEIKPVRLFILPHGALNDKPSYCWEMRDLFGNVFVAQITDAMLREGLAAAEELASTPKQ